MKRDEFQDIENVRSRVLSDGEIIRRLLRYVKPYLGELALALCLALSLVGLDLLGPLLFAKALDMLGQSDIVFAQIIWIVLGYIGILFGSAVLGYFETIVLQRSGQKVIYNIRRDVFNHIERLSIAQFNKVPIGKLVTRVTNDTDTLNSLYTDVLINALRSIFTVIGVLITMFVLNWSLALKISAVLPFVILATVYFRSFSRRTHRRARYHVAMLNAFLSEHLSGMKLIQIFNRESKKYTEFKTKNINLRKSHIAQTIVFSIYRPLMYMLFVIALLIILWFGTRDAMNGIISYGILLAFTQYISKLFDPIQDLAEKFDTLQSAFTSGERIFDILDTKPEVMNDQDAKELPVLAGKIEFRNVWFAYEGEDWILKDVSFTVMPGETVAFVGATGSGKTTILSLIVRNFDIQKGQILIDDIDIKSLDIGSLRQKVGQMMQDVFLFSGSVASNIRMKDEAISEAQIQEACEYVGADRFIKKLPGAYDEVVRERGNNFSSGERQLLSFARTIVHRPSVMILDEATANIDTETEALIQESLKKMMNIGTMLIVAHRLSTIQHVNKIIVMQKGKILETGNHQTLLRKKGHYYTLYRLQYDQKSVTVRL